MWNTKIFLSLLLYFISISIKTEADSSGCKQKEKNFAALDFAREAILKAKYLHPTCVNHHKNISSNESGCGIAEKGLGYLDIAMILIEEAKKNYSTCGGIKNLTKVVVVHEKPVDCSDILESGINKSGVYTIWPKHRVFKGRSLDVYCDMDTFGAGWTVIQRRGNFSQKVDFYRDWKDYKYGFGNVTEEFWIGNENIFALTNQGNYSVRFDMNRFDKEYFYATYSSFWIEDENSGYRLHFGNYSGFAGDGLKSSNKMKFTTKDKKNDNASNSCSFLERGGWWYKNCGECNPNGENFPGGKGNRKYMHWWPLTRIDSLLSIEIKIRAEN